MTAPLWGRRRNAEPGDAGWRPEGPLPPKPTAAWVAAQLDALERGAAPPRDPGALELLARLADRPPADSTPEIQARLLGALGTRLLWADPTDPHAIQRCEQRAAHLLARHAGERGPAWLRLLGVTSRLRAHDRALAGRAHPTRAHPAPEGPLPGGPRVTALFVAVTELSQALAARGDAESMARAGEAFVDAGRLDPAERCLLEATRRGARDPGRIAFHLARCAYLRGEYEDATALFDEAVAHGFPLGVAECWRAIACYETGRHEEAERLARSAIAQAVGAERATLATLLGNVELGRGAAAAAEERFTEAIGTDDRCLGALFGLGLCASQRGDDAAAARRFAALRHLPDGTAHAALGLGMLAARRGAHEEALRGFSRALVDLPGHAAANLRAGESLWALGRTAEAFPYLRRAEQLGLRPPGLDLQLGVCALAAGSPRFARRRLARVAGRDDARAFLLEALVAESRQAATADRPFVAALACERALRVAPNDERVRVATAIHWYRAGRKRLEAGRSAGRTAWMLERAWSLDRNETTFAGALAARMLAADENGVEALLAPHGSVGAASAFATDARFLTRYRAGCAPGAETPAAGSGVGGGAAPPPQAADPASRLDPEVRRFMELHLGILQLPERQALPAGAQKDLLETLGSPVLAAALSNQGEQLNRLAVSLLFRARGRQPVETFRQKVALLAAGSSTGFWDTAHVIALALVASRRPDADRAQALADVEATAAGVRQDETVRTIRTQVRRAIVAALLQAGELTEAGDHLARLQENEMDPLESRVRDSLRLLFAAGTPEAARLAATNGDLPRAVVLWQELSREGDSASAHHLACHLFRETFDRVATGTGDPLPLLEEALPLWKQVHESDPFWREASDGSCRRLGNNLFPYSAEAVAQARANLPADTLTVISELAAERIRGQHLEAAAGCVGVLLRNPWGPRVGREVLEQHLGDAVLLPSALHSDPQSGSVHPPAEGMQQALDSAIRLLQCDPEHRGALELALAAAAAFAVALEDAHVTSAQARAAFQSTCRCLQHYPESVIRDTHSLPSAVQAFWLGFDDVLVTCANVIVEQQNATPAGEVSRRKHLNQKMREIVDCWLHVVRPACQRLDVTLSDRGFERVDGELQANGYYSNPRQGC